MVDLHVGIERPSSFVLHLLPHAGAARYVQDESARWIRHTHDESARWILTLARRTSLSGLVIRRE